MTNKTKGKGLKLSIIGSGNMAFQFGMALYDTGHDLRQVVARNASQGEQLARTVGAQYHSSIGTMSIVDVVVIAVSDDAIDAVSKSIPREVSDNAMIIHTSGSVSGDTLNRHVCSAVVWPLQTIKKNSTFDWSVVPMVVTTDTDANFQFLKELLSGVSDKVVRMCDEDRSKLHIPAVMVNNFTTFLYGIAADVCRREGIDFSLLLPLIQETSDRLGPLTDPLRQLTGPAQRGDESTIAKHLDSLQNYPEAKKLYQVISNSIIDYNDNNAQ